jgi:KDO2-lipid IV(A) lauroyltransferase
MNLFSFKKGLRKIRYFLEAVSFFIFSRLITILPLKLNYRCGKVLGKLLFFFPRFRNRIIENLKIAYKNDYFQPKTTSQGIGENLYFSFVETVSFCLSKNKQKIILENTCIQGKENIDKILDKGKGVLLVTAHFGNFTLLPFKLHREGYPIYIVVKGSNNPWIVNQVQYLINRIELPYIPVNPWKICFNEIQNVLKRNEVVALLVDEKRRRGGIYVNFFGEPSSTTRGPATISLRSGAAIVPAFILRNSDYTHEVLIEEPIICPDNSFSQNEKIFFLTQKYSEVVEKYIRMYPALWTWTNLKWKPPHPHHAKKIKKKFPHFGLTKERKN